MKYYRSTPVAPSHPMDLLAVDGIHEMLSGAYAQSSFKAALRPVRSGEAELYRRNHDESTVRNELRKSCDDFEQTASQLP